MIALRQAQASPVRILGYMLDPAQGVGQVLALCFGQLPTLRSSLTQPFEALCRMDSAVLALIDRTLHPFD